MCGTKRPRRVASPRLEVSMRSPSDTSCSWHQTSRDPAAHRRRQQDRRRSATSMGDSVRRPLGRLAVVLSELLANKVNEATGPSVHLRGSRVSDQGSYSRAPRGGPRWARYLGDLRLAAGYWPPVEPYYPASRIIGRTSSSYPPSYFLDPEAWAELQDEIEMISAMRDVDVRNIAYRARGLSPRALRSVRAVIDHARSLEGLPDRGEQVDESGTDGKHEAEHEPRDA